MTLSIELPDERAHVLQTRADEAGLLPEALVRAYVEKWLEETPPSAENKTPPEKSFAEAAAYVLHKNAELYRRLA